RLGEGRLRINGNARFDAGVDPPTWGFEGDTGIDRLILLDSDRGQEVARWRDLQVSGINAASQPMAINIRSIRWLDPKLRLAIAADGSPNLNRLLKSPPSKEKGGKKAQERETAPGSDESAAAGQTGPAAKDSPTAPGMAGQTPAATPITAGQTATAPNTASQKAAATETAPKKPAGSKGSED